MDLLELRKELDRIEPDIDPPKEWLILGLDLCKKVESMLGEWPPSPPENAQEFARYAVALQHLDRWHKPILPSEIHLPRLAEHEALLDRAALDDRFNTNSDSGTVIARQAAGSPFLRLDVEDMDWDTRPSIFAIILGLLEICVFLPAKVMAGDPDDEHITDARHVGLSFRRFAPEEFGFIWPLDQLRIAVAPVAEAEEDAEIWVEDNRYAVHPLVPFSRFVEIIENAISERAHLLLLPEMTVASSHLPALKQAIRNLRRDAVRADPDRIQFLRLVLVGVIEEPHSKGGLHRNYVAAINGVGDILFTQDKLSHWNLDARAQSRFGIDTRGFPIPLKENTNPGDTILVAEFDGLGRVMTLICADMSHNMPGDWIADHIGLDWLFAPVMDGSTCWYQGTLPWIVNRALRICGKSGTNVLVWNSMVMTHWNNKSIASHSSNPGYPFKSYSECGIGFFARQLKLNTVMQHVTVSLSAKTSPVIRVVEWSSAWSPPPVL